MKRIITLTLLLIILVSGILMQVFGQMTYEENFDISDNWSGGAAGSYTEKAYSDAADPLNDGFTSDNAVRESTNSLSGYSWRLRNEGNPYFLYECSESVSSFSFFLAHWNLDVPMDITIEYSINSGVTYTLIAALDVLWWTDQGLEDKEYHQFLSGELNISPAEGEQIRIRLTTDGGERLLLDNFQLIYNNSSAGVQDPLEFVATTTSDSQINLIFVPNEVDDDVVIVFDEDGSFEQPSGLPPAAGSFFAGGTLLYSGIVSPQEHPGLMSEQTVFYSAWSFDGENYSNGLVDQATTNGSNEIPNAWINEVHYDNDGGDVNEFIEIVIENADDFLLDNIAVYLYNGSNGEVYASETADNFEQGTSSDNFTFFTWYYTGIQNGAPEGIALTANDVLIEGQLLSYEGDFIATEGPASGTPSTDMGVHEPTNNPIGHTLQLAGAGIQYDNFTWQSPQAGTPGVVNMLQEIGNFTYWTGLVNTNWEQEENWTNGVPNSLSGACIPDVSLSSDEFPQISSVAEAATLLIEPGALLDILVDGSLSIHGSFINYGTLTIHSDASGSGSIIEPNGVVANAQRFISQGQWHYLTSPITETYSDLFEGWYLTDWDEPNESWNFVEDLGLLLNPGMWGYSVWTNTSSTVTFSGVLNTGPVSVELSNTAGSMNPDNDPSGYNLVGNPYSSSLDWDIEDGAGWTRDNVALSIYYWNGTQYASYVKNGPNPGPNGGSNIIPPHQGFFVMCTETSGGQLAVNNLARIHGNQPFYKKLKTDSDYYRIKLMGNQLSDELILQVNDGSSSDFDPEYDAYKLYGCDEAPQAYTIGSDNSKLSVNTFPYAPNEMIVPMGYRSPEDGMLEIVLEDLNGNDTLPLYLEDLYDQIVIDLKQNGSYAFLSGVGEFTDRFLLHFSEEGIQLRHLSVMSETPDIFLKDQMIVIHSYKNLNGRVSIIDMCGREVYSKRIPDTDRMEINMNGSQGLFIVRMQSDQGIFSQKICISH